MACRLEAVAVVAVATVGLGGGCNRAVLDPGAASIGLDGGDTVGSNPDASGVGRAGSSDVGPGSADAPATLCPAPIQIGDGWVEIPTPIELLHHVLTDAWAVGREDLLFAGQAADASTGGETVSMRVARWSHGCWSVELSSPGFAGASPAVSGTSPDDVWAAMGTALFHREAGGWWRFDSEPRALLQAQNAELEARFDAVRAIAPGEVWVAGGHSVWRRVAGAWQMFELRDEDVFGPAEPGADPRGTFRFTSAMWAAGRDDVAVGGFVDVIGRIPDSAFIYRYAGGAWTRSGVSDGRVSALWGDGGGGLWIGAENGGWNSSLFHRDSAGATSVVAIDGWQMGIEASSLWGRAANDVWTAGGGNLARWDGRSWTAVAAPIASDRDDATIVSGDTGSIWVVSRGSRIFRLDR